MKISIVTPSFNQGKFIERTIRSVISQECRNREFIIVDGGSDDASVEIIQRFQKELSWWVSEPDAGQSSAINKGLTRSTGEIICWLNSDDQFADGAIEVVLDYFGCNLDVDILCGNVHLTDVSGQIISTVPAKFDGLTRLTQYWRSYDIHQPSVFWRNKVTRRIGLLNEQLFLTMDYDYWYRAAMAGLKFGTVDRVLSCATVHPAQKTAGGMGRYRRAQLATVWRHIGSPITFRFWRPRIALYLHLVSTGVRLLLGKPTVYDVR